jgi:hypothetical protein
MMDRRRTVEPTWASHVAGMNGPDFSGAVTVVWFVLGMGATLWLSGILGVEFAKPLALGGDHLFLLVQIKSFLDGYGLRLNPSLGFPGVQDNLLFPQFELSHRVLLYLLSKISGSIFVVCNLFYAISVAAMFASSFVVLRMLAVRAWLAAVASIAYVISPFFVLRAGGHDFLALYFGVPWGAALSYLVARVETFADLRARFLTLFAGASVLIAATSGLYYAFFTAMFVAVTSLGVSAGRRDWRPLAAGLGVCAVLFIVLIAGGLRWHIFEVLTGGLHQPQRLAIENLYFGLLISDSVHVANELGLFKGRFQNYVEAMRQVTGANYLFEWPGPLLTMVIVSAPFFVVGGMFDNQARRSDHMREIWLSLLLITFGLLFAMRGGLGFLFSYFITTVIRAPARIIPFLSFFALVAVCVWIELLLTIPTLRRQVLAAAAMVLLLVGLPERPFPLAALQKKTLANSEQMEFQASVQAMLKAKDEAGLRAILQLPHLAWPEVGPQLKFHAYQHQLPYLLDHTASATRWSYGLSTFQPGFAAVQRILEERKVDLSLPVRAGGFDGILIEKLAYSDQDIADWVESISVSLSPGCRIFEDRFRIMYSLVRPSDASICLPASPRRAPEKTMDLGFKAEGARTSYLVSGWSTPEQFGTWSEGRISKLYVPMPERSNLQAVQVGLTIGFYRPDPGRRKGITASVDGRVIATLTVAPNEELPSEWQLTLPAEIVADKPGVVLTFEAADPETPSAYTPGSDPRVLGFWLQRAVVEPAP